MLDTTPVFMYLTFVNIETQYIYLCELDNMFLDMYIAISFQTRPIYGYLGLFG